MNPNQNQDQKCLGKIGEFGSAGFAFAARFELFERTDVAEIEAEFESAVVSEFEIENAEAVSDFEIENAEFEIENAEVVLEFEVIKDQRPPRYEAWLSVNPRCRCIRFLELVEHKNYDFRRVVPTIDVICLVLT